MAHILLVEDVPPVGMMLREMLASFGHRVHWVPSGAAALDAARADKPDLILLDVVLPGLDGFAVCGKLKADAALATIPVVMCSARAKESDVCWAMHLGAADYLTKPISLDALRTTLAKHLAA